MAYIENNLVFIIFSKLLLNPLKDGHKNDISKTIQKSENSEDYLESYDF